MGVGLAALGLLFVLIGSVVALKERLLFRNGEARLGRVDKVEPVVQNNTTNYYVDYSFQADGARIQSTWVARGTAAPEVGPIWVIVAAENPLRSIPMLQSM